LEQSKPAKLNLKSATSRILGQTPLCKLVSKILYFPLWKRGNEGDLFKILQPASGSENLPLPLFFKEGELVPASSVRKSSSFRKVSTKNFNYL
jgi:hypothetical protein